MVQSGPGGIDLAGLPAWPVTLSIFLLRGTDTTLSTLRMPVVFRGRRGLAWILGFAGSLLVVLASDQRPRSNGVRDRGKCPAVTRRLEGVNPRPTVWSVPFSYRWVGPDGESAGFGARP